jgi:hypothetical protein
MALDPMQAVLPLNGMASDNDGCSTLLRCFANILVNGLRQGGGVGDIMEKESWDSPKSAQRMGYDFAFFALVNIIFLNILFGIIIDTFAELRDDKRKKEEDMNSLCFICGLGADVFDNEGIGFRRHVHVEHSMWMYLYFMHHLRRKDESEYTGQESYVQERVVDSDLSFFPHHRALCLKSEKDYSKDADRIGVESPLQEETPKGAGSGSSPREGGGPITAKTKGDGAQSPGSNALNVHDELSQLKDNLLQGMSHLSDEIALLRSQGPSYDPTIAGRSLMTESSLTSNPNAAPRRRRHQSLLTNSSSLTLAGVRSRNSGETPSNNGSLTSAPPEAEAAASSYLRHELAQLQKRYGDLSAEKSKLVQELFTAQQELNSAKGEVAKLEQDIRSMSEDLHHAPSRDLCSNGSGVFERTLKMEEEYFQECHPPPPLPLKPMASAFLLVASKEAASQTDPIQPVRVATTDACVNTTLVELDSSTCASPELDRALQCNATPLRVPSLTFALSPTDHIRDDGVTSLHSDLQNLSLATSASAATIADLRVRVRQLENSLRTEKESVLAQEMELTDLRHNRVLQQHQNERLRQNVSLTEAELQEYKLRYAQLQKYVAEEIPKYWEGVIQGIIEQREAQRRGPRPRDRSQL